MAWISESLNPFSYRKKPARPTTRRGSRRGSIRVPFEQLESRLALSVTPKVAPSNFPIQVVRNGDELSITYSQPDSTGFRQTTDQHVVIDIDNYYPVIGAPVTRVNVYASTNPQANSTGAGTSAQCVFLDICAIHVTVPNYDDLGVNNNSLTIKGINGPNDRIIISGSGRTSAGRWSDEAPTQKQVVFDIAGIDDTTVTAGGVINVSGAFTNDTGDASIHAVGEIAERQADQTTGTVVVGETTPSPGSLPQSRLVSNYVELIGAELDIYSDIEATGQVILRQPATTPQTGRANLILPYDVTVTDPDGVLELHSTKNIVQLQSSTLIAHKLVAVSNIGDINDVPAGNSEGPWMIDLGTATNDFDTISLGMTSNAIDTPTDTQSLAARGRIGVRDIDDLTVGDFGILAATGTVTLRSVGPLTIDSAVQATSLLLQSDTSVTTTPRAIVSVNSPTPSTKSEPVGYTDVGVTIDASKAAGDTATGDVTLDGRIVMDLNNIRDSGENKTSYGGLTIDARGVTRLNAQVLTLGDIRVHSDLGIDVTGQLQAGGMFVTKNGTATELVVSDLSLTTATGPITIAGPTANLPLPTTLSATNLLAFDGGGDISIAGSLFAGTIYGNTANLPEDNASLPSITIRSVGDISMASTAVLKTSAYGTNYNASPNPQIGLITVSDANTLTTAATVVADGGFTVSTRGDIAVSGPVTAREKVSLRTQTGDIDIQGALTSKGASYTTAAGSPPFVTPDSWTPDVVLDSPNGSIFTSDTGSLTAGTLVLNAVTSYGTVRLNAQQAITIGADIITPGSVVATSKLGAFTLSALLQSNSITTNPSATISIRAGNGIIESDPDLGRIVTDAITLVNTGAAGGASDIDLQSKDNQMKSVTATNMAVGGDILIANNGSFTVGPLTAQRSPVSPSTIALVGKGGISQTAPLQANNLYVANSDVSAITLGSVLNNVDNFAAFNPSGGVTYVDADGFETGIKRGGPLGVEVVADSLSLSSVTTFSVIRVVSGLAFRTLSIAAGTLGGSSVGSVEFVTTSPGDNPVGPFQGSLRDMVRYVNANAATYSAGGSLRPQPMRMVFDESGYPVAQVTLKAALPQFTRPVAFDGSRLEATVPTDRLGLQGVKNAATGLSFGLGSTGSSVSHTAVYGFTTGVGISLASGSNVVTDTFVGLKSDGVTVAPNKVGIDVYGAAGSGNLIGSSVFDPANANRFAGNSIVGIQVRAGAANNRIFGNIIGDESGVTPSLANGDGIRLNGARNTAIGTPNQTHVDLTASESNRIVGNKGSGIAILNSNAGSAATANRIRNNVVSGNGVGISITASQFAQLGGAGETAANVITSQKGAGISIAGSSNVSVIGNLVGTDAAASLVLGNAGDGIAVAGSQTIAISGGNRIVANKGNGVSIGAQSTGVTVTGNTIGGLLDDGVTPAGNGKDGIAIAASIGNSVGLGNQISRNTGSGVSVVDARSSSLLTGNRLFGSNIFANLGAGIRIAGGSGTTVGGTAARNANTITGNGGDGIRVDFSTATGAASGNAIQANFIGTNANQEVAPLGNGGSGISIRAGVANTVSDGNVLMNNAGNGVEILGGSGNVVGGTTAAKGNTLSNNGRYGVFITTTTGLPAGLASLGASRSQTVQGNTISYNGLDGVSVTGAQTTGITIGQTVNSTKVTGLGNVIEGNAGFGVTVAGAAQQVSVQGNSIAENIGGSTSFAAGTNTSATTTIVSLSKASIRQTSGGGTQLVIEGGIVATAANPYRTQYQQYTLDIYANSAYDSAYGGYQARRLLGRVTVTADANGNVDFRGARALTISAPVDVGEYITATATAVRYQPGSTTSFAGAVETRYFGI